MTRQARAQLLLSSLLSRSFGLVRARSDLRMGLAGIVLRYPVFKEENGLRWHSWDGHEWWRGEPDEVTRELTARRIASLEAAKAVAQNRFRWDRDSR